MRTIRIGAVVAVALVAGGCGATEGDPPRATAVQPVAAIAQPTEAEIQTLFTEWNAALATGDPEQVAARYAPDAVLLPTVSNKVRSTRAEIVDYFTEFLKKKPQGEITSSFVRVLDADDAIDAGTYTFDLTVDGEATLVPARYTFVYELREGKWLIVNHHSSVMPEE